MGAMVEHLRPGARHTASPRRPGMLVYQNARSRGVRAFRGSECAVGAAGEHLRFGARRVARALRRRVWAAALGAAAGRQTPRQR